MQARRGHVVEVAVAAVAVAAGGCGADGGEPTASGGAVDGPSPAEMCPAGQTPVVAAYAVDSGQHRWAACGTEQVWHSIVGADADGVYVAWYDTEQRVAAYDTGTGEALAPSEVPPDVLRAPTGPSSAPIVVDGMRIDGGQDDPTTGTDAATGELVWSQPGNWAYDDVAAVGDGAVFAVERPVSDPAQRVVGYEVATGEVRWAVDVADPYVESGWPWHVDGQRLFLLWFDLAVRSTRDGTVLWRTDFHTPPTTTAPMRMSDVATHDDTVFVAFSAVPSQGD